MDKCLENQHQNEIGQFIVLPDGLRACVQWVCKKCDNKRWEICKRQIVESIY